MWIDAHSHLSFLNDEHVAIEISRGISDGLEKWCLGGYDSQDWYRQKLISQEHPAHILMSFGIHPWKVIDSSKSELENEFTKLEPLLSQASFLGEVGLDYHRPSGKEKKDLQIEFFQRQLQIVASKPLVLHCVKAYEDTLRVLDSHGSAYGLVHGFSGSFEMAQEFIKRNFLISVGRIVLNSKAVKVRECLERIELKHLVIESDSPSSPGACSKANRTFFEVAEQLAELKKESVEHVLKVTSQNFKDAFYET